MKLHYWVLAASLAVLGTGCRKAPSSEQAPQLLRPAFIKDIMDSMVNPSGEFVFDSVYQISDEHGIREIAPHTDADWEAVRQRVVILLEAPNLLVMPGRKVAPPDVTSQNPGIELEPAQIQQAIDGDRLAFLRRARGLQDAAAVAMKAVDAKNKDALFQAEGGIDKACESCHIHYWYPNDKRAREIAESEGITY
jgi:cytochrome c556